MPIADRYTIDERRETSDDASFDRVDHQQVARLHLHWIWADHARLTFGQGLETEGWTNLDGWTERVPCARFVWYGFLYVVLEGFTARRVLSRGPVVIDVDQVRESLRNARHAMFHVDRDHDCYDLRLIAVVRESADQVRRAHHSLGELAIDEMRHRPDGEH